MQGLIIPLKADNNKINNDDIYNSLENNEDIDVDDFLNDENDLFAADSANNDLEFGQQQRKESLPLPPKELLKLPQIPSILSRADVASYVNIGTST